MARVWQTGFEIGSNAIFNLSAAGTISSGAGAPGSWSTYYLQGSSSDPQATLPSAISEIYFGMRFRMDNYANARIIVQFYSPSATAQSCFVVTTGGVLQWRRGSSSGTILGTGTTVLSNGVWYYIEGRLKVHDTTGIAEAKINGTSELNLTSQDTRNDASNATIDRFLVADSNLVYLDDIYMNDTSGSVNTAYSGDIRITGYIPNADGSNSGMTLSTGSNHYAVVDERPPNTTDYAYGTGTTETDTLNIPATSGVNTVQAATLWLYAQKSDAGAGNIAHVVKSSGTTDTGSDIALSSTWAYYSKIYDQDPNGPTNWTASAIDSLEIGAKSR